MSARREKLARQYAKPSAPKFDEAFASQLPRWFVVLKEIAPGLPLDAWLRRPLEKWRARMAKPNADYKRHALKIQAQKARRMLREVQG